MSPSAPVTVAVLAICGMLAAGAAAAQDGAIKLAHSGGSAPTRFTFAGEKNPFEISDSAVVERPRGTRLCVDVAEANPLLYTYSVTAETLAVKTPETASAFVQAFRAFLPGKGPLAVSLAPPQGPYTQYVAELKAANEALGRIDSAKWASDAGSFKESDAVASGQVTAGATALANARKVREANAAAPDFQSDAAKLLSIAEGVLGDRLKAVKAEWDQARSQVGANGVWSKCIGAGNKVLRLSLTVGTRVAWPESQLPRRYTGKVFERIELHPTNEQLYAFSAGALLGIFNDVPTFSVVDGIVAEGADDRHPLRPAALLLARPRRDIPVWAAIGVGTGAENIDHPDLFLGGVLKVGGEPDNALITLGAGALLSSFRSGLPAAIKLGQPLPTDLDLNDALEFRSRWGLGVLVTVYGVDFAK